MAEKENSEIMEPQIRIILKSPKKPVEPPKKPEKPPVVVIEKPKEPVHRPIFPGKDDWKGN
ncbi:unnamed protein product [Coffea canephora]|uniref:Uncharacterized protein n=1 Tax=Coffea canephora TaxID=49390 RepID=A0A068USH2_COFCA|nr:unnamed protein product [Coffea canephora]